MFSVLANWRRVLPSWRAKEESNPTLYSSTRLHLHNSTVILYPSFLLYNFSLTSLRPLPFIVIFELFVDLLFSRFHLNLFSFTNHQSGSKPPTQILTNYKDFRTNFIKRSMVYTKHTNTLKNQHTSNKRLYHNPDIKLITSDRPEFTHV
jgi:hypothetical protein